MDFNGKYGRHFGMKKNTKRKKRQFYTVIGIASIVIVGAMGILLFRQPSQATVKDMTSHLVTPKEGTVASSILLSGTVTVKNEQYVYFEASMGEIEEILVSVGDKVEKGQALVKYNSSDAQAAYDAANRAVAKIDRHISELKESRSKALTYSEYGGSESNTVSSLDSQIKDACDNRADAEAQVKKAKAQLDATTILSTIEGTVVEVNRDLSKSSAGNGKVIVHIVSNENLQVKGELSEYNLAKLSVGQEVTFTSKVYPDKAWTGKINYIATYSKSGADGSNGTGASNVGPKYPYTIEITSDIGELKQGFSVSVEVKSDSTSLLVPLTSIVEEEGKNYVWVVDEENKAKKIEVSLGNADAENQEITSGLTNGAKVISNPTTSLEEGKEVKADEETN